MKPPRVSSKVMIIGAGLGTTATRSIARWISSARAPPLLITHWRGVLGTPQGLGDEAWRKVHGQLMALPPKRHATFDYTILEKWDGVMDTPMAELFPYILAAFPRAKVILSVRNATEWSRSRKEHHKTSPVPFAALTEGGEGSVASIIQKHSYGTQNNSETSDSALLFETHNLLVRCLVPPAQLLEVNVFVEGGEAAMRRVQTFVNSTSSAGGRPSPPF